MVGEAREWQKRKMTVHEAPRTHSRPRATHRGATHGNRPHRLPPRLKCCAEETSIETDLSPAYRGLKKTLVHGQVHSDDPWGRAHTGCRGARGRGQPTFLSQPCGPPAVPEPSPQPASRRRWTAAREPRPHTQLPHRVRPPTPAGGAQGDAVRPRGHSKAAPFLL